MRELASVTQGETFSPLATSSPRVHGREAAQHDRTVAATLDAAPGHRRAGMLLHVTSIPGPDGIGDLGAPARDFVTWLAQAGQRLWQTLPLHPPSNEAMSPYDASSAFAGNPMLLSLDDLVALGLLPPTLTATRSAVGAGRLPAGHAGMVAGQVGGTDVLARIARWKLPLVRQAARQLLSLGAEHELTRDFLQFCERESWWLADHAAFTALREQYPNVERGEWPLEDRVRGVGAHVGRASTYGATHQHPEAGVQYLFFRQLRELHAHARASDVWIMGDAPIYVGDDSADVWAHPDLFLLDEERRPARRTGAPADAMDPGGQVWPMPPYDWAANKATGYEWWFRRLRHELQFSDVLRIDHFRAFADWWSVPPRAAFGEQGQWELGPGAEFFRLAREQLGEMELIVEDLGADTPHLQRLREETALPQMRVLVQGFDEGGDSVHLPTAWDDQVAAYTDTHDFDTIAGWAARAAAAAAADDTDRRLDFALRFTGAVDQFDLPRASIDMVLRSSARFAVIPLQDWLGLGSLDRMNVPGTADGNWRWIAPTGVFTEELAAEIAIATARSVRGAAT
ncbi:MAG: 4-alpha-glucanotransferase [Thermoleophilia bacterium]|nr:4-alpha-glucanotransferase [Thermoleophilia bacterium]